jgi:ubiquitin conjugation factor E4 B
MLSFFLVFDVSEKVACMLNFYLRQMVGKKYHDINVKNPGRFKFEPRELVVQIARVMLVLGKHEKFLQSCAAVI